MVSKLNNGDPIKDNKNQADRNKSYNDNTAFSSVGLLHSFLDDIKLSFCLLDKEVGLCDLFFYLRDFIALLFDKHADDFEEIEALFD